MNPGMDRNGSDDGSARREYFFEEGIRFACTQCGLCCTGEPGLVYVDRAEAVDIASFLDIPFDVLTERMLTSFKDGYTAREVDDGRCIFYENGCVIYPVRPVQCVTFPFWFQNMRSLSAWDEACLRCPGIGRGRLFTRDEILSMIDASYPVYVKAMEWLYK
jgi:Fe-S-cluster containining protein